MSAKAELPALILGAGAAGLMCATQTPPGTVVVDHARAPGEKIRISGGGRCNFTNLGVSPEAYLSQNPHFCKSALARYTQWDFLDLVQRHGIAWHEKTLGQLFCDGKATQIVQMLVTEAEAAGAQIWTGTQIGAVRHDGSAFVVEVTRDGRPVELRTAALVLATGGKPIPKMGATDLSLRLVQQFGLTLTETRPALVPLTFGDLFAPLAGTSTQARVTAGQGGFAEALLFTHRGLSGPAVLQASSYWREGAPITVDLDPEGALAPALRAQRAGGGRILLRSALARALPKRLVAHLDLILPPQVLPPAEARLADQSDAALDRLVEALRLWQPRPTGTEGYRTAEVMLGGVSTDGLNARSLAAKHLPGLYVIGEAVDVTGWLGGYNFQWAWASGWAAGQAIRGA